MKGVHAVRIVNKGRGLGVAEGFGTGDARVATGDVLQLVRILGKTAVYQVDVIVIFVVYHPDGRCIILILNKKEGSGIHIEELVHQMDGLLVFEVVVELMVLGDGLAFLC